MTQQSNTTNWVFQGTNGVGQPQMFKLVQTTRPITLASSAVSSTPVKIFKPPINNGESSQAFSSSGGTTQLLRTIGTNQKLVTKSVPLQLKGTKTIRLTPSQMQNIRFVNPSTKLQLQQQQHPLHQSQPSPTITSSSGSSNFSQVPISPIMPSTAGGKTISPPILSRKRLESFDSDISPEVKRGRKTDKIGKGLRHFSMKVCEKVKQKGSTTYNEVADELVGEFTNSSNTNSLAEQYDQKNIRRRVYDALNVLMAMNIISKEKKEIRWIGLPTNSLQECQQLEKEVMRKTHSIREKERQLDELILNQIAFKSLAQRNKEVEQTHGAPCANSYIQLPFIVVNTNKKTVINCSISNDKLEYVFQFSDQFEITDDLDILKQIGMLSGIDNGSCSPQDLQRIKQLIPESLWPHLEKMANGRKSAFDNILSAAASTACSMPPMAEEFVEATLDEESSRQSSSCDPLSPGGADYSDDDGESDMSSDTELN